MKVGAQIKILFEGIRTFPGKTNEIASQQISSQLQIEQFTDELSRLTIKNKPLSIESEID